MTISVATVSDRGRGVASYTATYQFLTSSSQFNQTNKMHQTSAVVSTSLNVDLLKYLGNVAYSVSGQQMAIVDKRAGTKVPYNDQCHLKARKDSGGREETM